jgi:hypothetical protein
VPDRVRHRSERSYQNIEYYAGKAQEASTARPEVVLAEVSHGELTTVRS